MAELLLLAGNHDISFVVDHPELLTFNIERRLKPRIEILRILEKKDILRRKPSLTTICKIMDKQFSEKYVLPYLNELGENGKWAINVHSELDNVLRRV
ncbi:Mitochodrial transcription termination factor [Parasponia andersonii]|uniref:Mitochodrial transcription termination factor n=1 Tax=Parasponia andersonii TaxID=3476 RepID=A0A2P5CKT6_PARAD|nr:Mitochodrial transcription termination factor [Parasponia andersonii]